METCGKLASSLLTGLQRSTFGLFFFIICFTFYCFLPFLHILSLHLTNAFCRTAFVFHHWMFDEVYAKKQKTKQSRLRDSM